MPTPLADGAIVLLTAEYIQNGQTMLNTLHFKYERPLGAPDYTLVMEELFDSVQTAGDLQDDITGSMHNSCTFVRWLAQPVYPTRLAKRSRVVNAAGPRGGTALPQNSSASITKLTDLATRYGRGSWHMVGMVTTDNVSGTCSAAFQVLMDQLGDSIQTDRGLATLGDMHPGLWSPAVPTRFTQLTSWRSETTMRVMRRRTVGVGK